MTAVVGTVTVGGGAVDGAGGTDDGPLGVADVGAGTAGGLVVDAAVTAGTVVVVA